ncbi:hypothetical protein [Streptococcus pluranimalium]
MYLLIPRGKRQKIKHSGGYIYVDQMKGNQCPYYFTKKFLSTFCKGTLIPKTQLTDKDVLIFITTGDNGQHWLLDSLFYVEKVYTWNDSNNPEAGGMPKYSKQEFNDHYSWVLNGEHVFKRKKRRTIVANEESFQPQTINDELLDITDILLESNISIKNNRGYNLTKIDCNVFSKIENIAKNSEKKYCGCDFMKIYEQIKK